MNALDPFFIFLGQVLLFWSVWKLLDHTVPPAIRRFKERNQKVVEPEKKEKTPRKTKESIPFKIQSRPGRR